jgi:hypothetical protein
MNLHDIARAAIISPVEVAMAASAPLMGPLLILVAGPYRSGTNDDPTLIANNLDRLERAAFEIYNAGHIPLIGEWVALPVAKQAGSNCVGDAISAQYFYPVAHRLLQRCDAVYRIEGASKGADQDVQIARERGLPVYLSIEEISEIGSAYGRV